MTGDTRIDHVWMDSKETAAYLRLSWDRCRRLLAAGVIRSTQSVPGGRRLVHREWADEWVLNRGTHRRSA